MVMENTMVMGRKLVVTTNLSAFENVPNINGNNRSFEYQLFDAKIPTNIILGKTYYTIYEGDFIAFRIKAYSYVQHFTKSTLWCFVENAIGDAYWSNAILNNKIFESVEDYYNYLASGNGNVKIEYAYFSNLKDGKGFCLKNTYYWHKEKQRPQTTDTKIHYILVDENNVYVGVDYTHRQYGKEEQGFTSGEECIKANVNGMKIIEFAEPKVSFSFHIEEPKEPKVRVLKFID
jgi:hypothetical protein